MVLHEFHLVADIAAGRPLKTIEEPPPSTRFIVLAETVPPGLVTIASRCVRVDFRVIADATVADALIAGGHNLKAVQNRMGHASSQTTLTHYAAARTEDVVLTAGAMSAYLKRSEADPTAERTA